MTCYKIAYTRRDMPTRCEAIKHAHTEEEALKHLTTGNSKKGYKLKRSGVSIEVIAVKKLPHTL